MDKKPIGKIGDIYIVPNTMVFCPLLGKEIADGYCWELCNIATDDMLMGEDKVDDWNEAQKICKKCGRYD